MAGDNKNKTAATQTINITWAYPDMLNLHGDRANVQALAHVCDELGINSKVVRIDDYATPIDFENTDILLFNPGEVKTCANVIDALLPQLADLKKYIEAGKVVFVVGTTGAAFAKTLTFANADIIKGLGLLDMVATERTDVYGNDLFFEFMPGGSAKKQEIAGIQIKLVDFEVSGPVLGKVAYGAGNTGGENFSTDPLFGDDNSEGARNKNLIFTNALGPVLVKNPWFARYLIDLALLARGVDPTQFELDPGAFLLEKKSLEATRAFIKKKGGFKKPSPIEDLR